MRILIESLSITSVQLIAYSQSNNQTFSLSRALQCTQVSASSLNPAIVEIVQGQYDDIIVHTKASWVGLISRTYQYYCRLKSLKV